MKIRPNIIHSLIITAIYFVVLIIIALKHEPFSDEVNVMFVLRNYSGIEFWKYVITDGNPPWFFFLAWPFAKLGLSFFSLQILCVLFNVAAVFLLNAFSPFPLVLNLLITISAPFLYFYPIIARSYAVLPFFFILAAYSHVRLVRDNNSFISLILYAFSIGAIAGSHVTLLGFSIAALCFFLYDIRSSLKIEKEKYCIAILIAAFPIVFMLVQSFIALGTVYNIPFLKLPVQELRQTLVHFFATYFDSSAGPLIKGGLIAKDSFFCYAGATACLFLTAGCIFLFYRIKPRYGLIGLAGLFFDLYVHIKYPIVYPYRVYIIHLIFMFLFWVALENEKISSSVKNIGTAILLLLFFISVPTGLYSAYRDYWQMFSSSKDMSDFIEREVSNDENTAIIASYPWVVTSVSYYLKDRNIYTYNGDAINALMIPGRFNNLSNDLSQKFDGMSIYYLIPKMFMTEMTKRDKYVLLYSTPDSIVNLEDFCIYSVK